MGEVVPKITVKDYTLSRQINEDEYYVEHDTHLEADPSSEYYPYAESGSGSYPSITQGPWVKTEEGDKYQQRDELGFTHPNLHRRLDAKLPDDELEVGPRDYSVSIMGVNSHRTTTSNMHVDYQFLDDYIASHPQYEEQIRERAAESESREIP